MTQSISMQDGSTTIFCEHVKLTFWMGGETMHTAEQKTPKMHSFS